MYYFENEEKYKKLGIDYDLIACLEYNPQDFGVNDIKKVLAVVEGEHDEKDWHWILKLKDKRLIYLRGGCDYTGWDCQSWASSTEFKTKKELETIILQRTLPVQNDNQPYNAGLGHMLSILSGNYDDDNNDVLVSLLKQMKSKKSTTWREKTDQDFPDFPKL